MKNGKDKEETSKGQILGKVGLLSTSLSYCQYNKKIRVQNRYIQM